ncbi:peptidyl-tRNA hydrolase [Solidesulfovibrio carbinoliphilus subsp. oakridgensis]|uniref:Peptidyl-tRNA hydrolase n=1 Tax=Solidesulfovibrio carbinoliphilus subsp. oakridgensis TaxID=694327 RepID=G7Q4F3_9BACT|nr:aminoacyl-tRNA hydrolase [Solidesulfovibrio carbinoliphilus]EHJ47176.1 peptidyl-tRNA hydrolase [Solidesulfovibrio carbinoliphilus subsp. oakridgensis]
MAVTALIVGLGNPGPRYAATRHNYGFMAVDAVIDRARELGGAPKAALSARKDMEAQAVSLPVLPGGAFAQFLCLKPLTFMNLSGRAVRAAMDFYKLGPTDVLVLHDELDLPLGRMRAKRGGGNAGHNGLKSLTQELGSPDFVRLRLGIGRPEPGRDVAGYVLEPFRAEEIPVVRRVLPAAVDGVMTYFEDGLDAAMRRVGGFDPAL